MVRHSHHHVPAHIGGMRYVPPCCGCGGINRSNLRRDDAAKRVKEQAGLENLQNMQKAMQKEKVPQHVRDMAGIKIKQQLSADTTTFAKVLQQKGVSKEKALEKLLDKLVGMYTSEKELMKALKNMELSKLLELLKKALSTVNEGNLGEEETLKKNVKKAKEKGDIIHKNEEAEEDDDDDSDKEGEEKDSKKEKQNKKQEKKLKPKKQKEDRFELEEEKEIKTITDLCISNNDKNETSTEITEISNTDTDKTEPKLEITKTIPIKLNENNIKFSGNSYSINAVNLLKEQEDIEMNKIRHDKLYKDKKNPLIKDVAKTDPNKEKQDSKKAKIIEEKRLKELEKENDKLKRIIMNLQKERRETLIAGINNE